MTLGSTPKYMARSTSTRVPRPPPTAAPRPTGTPRRSSMLSLRRPICHRIAGLPHLRPGRPRAAVVALVWSTSCEKCTGPPVPPQGCGKEFARRAEALGFDALWVAEHFLEAPGLYGTVWMSPLPCLAHAASVTTRIRLATGLLIAPY